MEENKKPFNDAIDHFNKIEGNPLQPRATKVKDLPKPLKYFGYFIIGFFVVSIILAFILNVFL